MFGDQFLKTINQPFHICLSFILQNKGMCGASGHQWLSE
jgi:hypothetical protein